ncbi:RING zinc finger-containing protein [Heterostelium album PN500]|uniref:RING-type E3 ubiquitin transferase n=1 Tax=Heterostelium pallidum (strain ATCC 26659 / Pp 5 / PN500) TaxID=670386 RepID=D3BRV7_HETP5|nr:RING zinc finger-containing protein [Heterostelium album PN500]EFA76139.1 RING zinc finger-containing protein [Heterostelium album PN500]|eukprot:XP_020428273.1 RING zinc finger-containing protein [Heterostelium album PN500]
MDSIEDDDDFHYPFKTTTTTTTSTTTTSTTTTNQLGNDIDMIPINNNIENNDINGSSSSSKKLINEEHCPICLSEIEDITFLDICFHHFCYICILQWSEISGNCPLCKSNFQSLIHDVKSNKEYKRHLINNKNSNNNANNSNNRRLNHQQQQQQQQQRIFIPNNNSNTSSHEFRRSVYARQIKAIPMVPPFKLYLSPQMISANYSRWKSRLSPWIKRELQAILQTEQVDILEEMILSLLKKHTIDSAIIIDTLKRFLFDKTDLFLHELLCFACSHYNIQAYDQNVTYHRLNNNNNNNNNSETQKRKRDIEDNNNNVDDIIDVDAKPLTDYMKNSKSIFSGHIPPILNQIILEKEREEDETIRNQRLKRLLRSGVSKEPNWCELSKDNQLLTATISTLNSNIQDFESLLNPTTNTLQSSTLSTSTSTAATSVASTTTSFPTSSTESRSFFHTFENQKYHKNNNNNDKL